MSTLVNSDANTLGKLSLQIKELEVEVRRLKNSVERSNNDGVLEAPAPRYQILYRLDGSTFPDVPPWTRNKTGKVLRAATPLSSVDKYLEKNKDIAFVIYKDYEKLEVEADGSAKDPPDPCRESVKFTSDAMIQAVKCFLSGQPHFSHFDLPEEIPAPYIFWYCCRSSYKELLSQLDRDQRLLIELFSRWVEKNHGSEYRNSEQLLSKGRVSQETMKYMVRPGDVLVSMGEGPLKAYKSMTWTTAMGSDPFCQDIAKEKLSCANDEKIMGQVLFEEERCCVSSVTAWSWEYNGEFRRRVQNLEVKLHIRKPDEEVPIASLEVFPLRYASEEIRDTLAKRGQTYWKCRKQKLVDYYEAPGTGIQGDIERYMVDYDTYEQHDGRNTFKAPRGENYDQVLSSAGPQGSEIYLFPDTIKGYNLRYKVWVDLDVDRIEDVKWNKEAFQRLVADKDTKELIQALVRTHLTADSGVDLIGGKGNGLIMLLHGGPGTGKTFTAETVAELAEKPLYRVTCGDIRTKPEDVEHHIESALHLGKIWDCVVLLDEADVFLEERSLSDLDRNAIVSIFLRVLEYYEGILILTSNRVATFDRAFTSRIHLALRYENLDRKKRQTIWSNFLQHLSDVEGESIHFQDLKDHLEKLAKFDLNGRQIRNAITSARQLAKYREQIMNYSHLEHVIELSIRFDEHLQGISDNLTDDQIARSNGVA